MAAPSVEDLLEGFALAAITKAAWELRQPQILAEAGREGLSLPEITKRLYTLELPPSAHHDQSACEQALRRILHHLAAHHLVRRWLDEHNNETYSLPPTNGDHGDDIWHSIAPWALFLLHPYIISRWHKLPRTVLYGIQSSEDDFYTMVDSDPAFRRVFDDAMVSFSSACIRWFCTTKYYDVDPDRRARSLVDVGGGSGHFAASIARHYPHLQRVINFDLPPVVASAPKHPGVEHIQGDMFQSIPSTDIILMKSVLHNWSDDDCIRVLLNCRKSLIGVKKLVILDVIHENTILDETNTSTRHGKLALDTKMLALFGTKGGKERTQAQWSKILKDAKFKDYNFIENVESRLLYSIIEATVD